MDNAELRLLRTLRQAIYEHMMTEHGQEPLVDTFLIAQVGEPGAESTIIGHTLIVHGKDPNGGNQQSYDIMIRNHRMPDAPRHLTAVEGVGPRQPGDDLPPVPAL